MGWRALAVAVLAPEKEPLGKDRVLAVASLGPEPELAFSEGNPCDVDAACAAWLEAPACTMPRHPRGTRRIFW